MNTPNRRPMPYRKRRRRRQTLRVTLIVLACVLAALVTAFMIIGNMLLDAIDEPTDSDSEQGRETAAPASELAKASQIGGYPLLVQSADSSTFANRLSALTDAGAAAVSLPLNTSENVLLYRSDVAARLGLQSASAPTVSLETAVSIAKQSGVYVSGIFTMTAFEEENDLVRSVQLSHAAAIVTEAFRAGIDDVLLLAPAWTDARLEELIRFTESVRAMQSDAVLGFAIARNVFDAQEPSSLLDQLSQSMNYLAMDATYLQGDDPVSAVDGLIHDPQYHYDILYYEMRILLPDGADENQRANLIHTTEASGIRNWQILPNP